MEPRREGVGTGPKLRLAACGVPKPRFACGVPRPRFAPVFIDSPDSQGVTRSVVLLALPLTRAEWCRALVSQVWISRTVAARVDHAPNSGFGMSP